MNPGQNLCKHIGNRILLLKSALAHHELPIWAENSSDLMHILKLVFEDLPAETNQQTPSD